MNATTPTTEGTHLFRSPLHITPEAVELRGWRYPLSDVKSARVVPIATNKGAWEFGILFFDLFGASRIGEFAVELRFWELKVDGSRLAILLGGIVAYLLLAYLLRYLYKRTQKNWRYIYAVGLATGYRQTLVAASHDRTYIANIVVAISNAIAQHQNRKAAAVEPSITYDNYFQIDDNYINVPGWSVPLSDVKYATRTSVEDQSTLTRVWSGVPVGFLVASVTFKSILELGGPWSIVPVIFLVVAVVIVLLLFGKRQKDRRHKVDTLDRVYIANVGTPLDLVPVLISVDKDYVDRFVSVVNEAVRKRDRKLSRHSKVTVRGST
jgi:hypothetical protein